MTRSPQPSKYHRRLLLAGAAIVLGLVIGSTHIIIAKSAAPPMQLANSAPTPKLANPDALDVNGDKQVDVLDAYLLARQNPPRTSQMRMLIAHITSTEAAE
jgi:hypothetical protein